MGVLHVGVDVETRDAEVRSLYIIHRERPIHRVLDTVQRQGTSGQLKYRVQYQI